MNLNNLDQKLLELKKSLDGNLYSDETSKLMYATDASAYREKPLAVIRPRTVGDIKKIIAFANREKTSIIPRTAGTSLAGQVVGGGIVVDVSKYMTRIIEFNVKDHWVRVQPGVVLDELNQILEHYGLFFGPETSTSNRCMIGGMVGNNACGLHSIVYGSTRDHTISVKAILSDGSHVEFCPLTVNDFKAKCKGDRLENKIYQNIFNILSNPENQREIREQFPDKSIKRRNTGYAIDLLLETVPFTKNGELFNFCKLIAGSEGTLAFITEIKLNLVALPSMHKGLICVHFKSVKNALKGNLIALKYKPDAIELIDHIVINCTKDNIEQRKNRFFIQGDPEALLIIEFSRKSKEEILKTEKELEADMRAANLGYHFPALFGEDINKVWALRKAGLGLLSNIPGDKKPVTVIEDTSINVKVLSDYVNELKKILNEHGLSCVFYGHIATGELHLHPVLNLKDPKDVELFHIIGLKTVKLVKKYKGSLSGEHGDGRLRGEFIPIILGEKNFGLLKEIKNTWDPNNIFNPKKIIDTPPMNTSLRYKPGQETRDIETYFDFSKTRGIIRAVENCNGSGDCRKSELIGGTMCPSYMATRDEWNTTRARANILREFLTHSPKNNPFDHKEIYELMDLCLSCKGCKSECPSNVDMTKLKAEFLQHYYDSNGISIRTRLIAHISTINRLGAIVPFLFNFFSKNKFISGQIKKALGFASQRSIPLLYKMTLRRWARKNLDQIQPGEAKNGKINLFVDEFTNYNDTKIGIKAIQLLTKLDYRIEIPRHKESGRAYLSKGLLRKAKIIANKNVEVLQNVVSEETPLLGIEPSAILTFRDEYPDLVKNELKEAASRLACCSYMVDEFLAREMDKGKISKDQFTLEQKNIKLHGHCQQKAVISTDSTRKILSFPENYTVEEIKSGCCGMAGSFGYEKEHYELSMEIGELSLFPEIRKAPEKTIIAAPGTSCRQQIKDGTGKDALHPIEILYNALNLRNCFINDT